MIRSIRCGSVFGCLMLLAGAASAQQIYVQQPNRAAAAQAQGVVGHEERAAQGRAAEASANAAAARADAAAGNYAGAAQAQGQANWDANMSRHDVEGAQSAQRRANAAQSGSVTIVP